MEQWKQWNSSAAAESTGAKQIEQRDHHLRPPEGFRDGAVASLDITPPAAGACEGIGDCTLPTHAAYDCYGPFQDHTEAKHQGFPAPATNYHCHDPCEGHPGFTPQGTQTSCDQGRWSGDQTYIKREACSPPPYYTNERYGPRQGQPAIKKDDSQLSHDPSGHSGGRVQHLTGGESKQGARSHQDYYERYNNGPFEGHPKYIKVGLRQLSCDKIYENYVT